MYIKSRRSNPLSRLQVLLAGIVVVLASQLGFSFAWSEAELDTMHDRQWIWKDSLAGTWNQAYLDSVYPPDFAPKRKVIVNPDFPVPAYLRRVEGTVKVNVLIDEKGKVVKALIKEDSGVLLGFEESALEAARLTEWIPAEKDGNEVPVWTSYKVVFQLPEGVSEEPVAEVAKWRWKLGEPASTNYPDEDEFVAVEERPEVKSRGVPRYPNVARKAGVEGAVWVKVLIGTDGRVKQALIAKSSGTNAGFEEATLASALETIWKPAKFGGKPIPLWVVYEVKFRLK